VHSDLTFMAVHYCMCNRHAITATCAARLYRTSVLLLLVHALKLLSLSSYDRNWLCMYDAFLQPHCMWHEEDVEKLQADVVITPTYGQRLSAYRILNSG
jgi:hypothetical protein